MTLGLLKLYSDLARAAMFSPLLVLAALFGIGFAVYAPGNNPPSWADPVINGLALSLFISLGLSIIGVLANLLIRRAKHKFGTALLNSRPPTSPTHPEPLPSTLGSWRVRQPEPARVRLSRASAPILLRHVVDALLVASLFGLLAVAKPASGAAGQTAFGVVFLMFAVVAALFHFSRTIELRDNGDSLTFTMCTRFFGIPLQRKSMTTPRPLIAAFPLEGLRLSGPSATLSISHLSPGDLGLWEGAQLTLWARALVPLVSPADVESDEDFPSAP
ncbi:MAG: hypothetical protein HEQ23_09295 [Tepidisphaera sp.]